MISFSNQYTLFTSCKLLTLLSCFLTFHIGQASEIPSWDKLAEHQEAPDWFRDAKFGIYFHWGPYSVPAFGNEHYPRTMYGHPSGHMPIKSETKRNYNLGVGFQSFREHPFHIETFGEPSEFEYHHFIPLFKGNILMLMSGLNSLRTQVQSLPGRLLSIMMDMLCGTQI